MIDISSLKLGRHVDHDPASRAYPVLETPGRTISDIVWTRYSPILNQGDLGSCVANAATGLLACEPFCHSTADAARFDEAFAVSLYSLITHIDNIPGAYPPDDTGSSGLGAGRALRQRGLCSSYRWAFSANGLIHALQDGPVLLGMAWHEDMFAPDVYGVVHPRGTVVGGHEVLCRGYREGMLICDNSWGEGWGPLGGSFLLPLVDGWDILHREHGDVVAPRR